jgi:molecular chaperone DnaK (HSP70)
VVLVPGFHPWLKLLNATPPPPPPTHTRTSHTSHTHHTPGEDFDQRVMEYFIKLIKKKYKV